VSTIRLQPELLTPHERQPKLKIPAKPNASFPLSLVAHQSRNHVTPPHPFQREDADVDFASRRSSSHCW